MTKRKPAADGAASDAPATQPKRLGRRSAEESRETRRALLNAAVLEFSEKGMTGARIDEIAERAGVTKGAIYTHFDGREDLLVQACRSAIRSLDMMSMATDATDLESFLAETAQRLLDPEARSARLLISELYTSAMRSEGIAELLGEWHAEFVGVVEARLGPGDLSPEAVALGLNFLHVALSHMDVYDSMNVGRDEVLTIVSRAAAAMLADR